MDEKGEKTTGQSLSEREPVQVPRSQITVKTAATVSVVALTAVAMAWVIVHSAVSITLTIFAALLAIALSHGVDRLEGWHIHRGFGILIVLIGLLSVIAGIGLLLIPAAASQVQDLISNWPQYWERVQHSAAFLWLNEHVNLQQRLAEMRERTEFVRQSAPPAFRVVSRVFAGLGGVLTVFFLSIFMVLYGGRLVRGALSETLPAHRALYERVLGKIYSSIGGYITGLCGIALLNATLMSIFLAIIRVPFFLPLAILSGLGSFVPLIGVTVSGVLIVLVALAAHGGWAAIAAIAYIAVYQQFENHVVGPLVYKRTVEVSPLVTILGFIFFAELAGIVGAFLTVPIIAAGQIIVRELLILRRERLGLPLEGEVAQVPPRRPFWRKPRPA